MTGLTLDGATDTPIIHYATTAGGRNIIQTWGDDKVMLDYNLSDENTDPSLFDRFGRIKTMDIRKMTSPPTTIHKYEYGYDANGNRAWMRSTQEGHVDERDYLYGYDRLNRLTHAERGDLNVVGDAVALGGKGRACGLDLLGNWSGDLDFGAIGRLETESDQNTVCDTDRRGGPCLASGALSPCWT